MQNIFRNNILINAFTGVLILMFFIFSKSVLGQDYKELYRPQIHVSPTTGFMGDPNGPLKYEGKYRFYWWGHMDSNDLIYWREINKDVLNGTPSGFGEWSGCVVIDTANTSGLSQGSNVPRIALFTLNNNSNGNQSVAAAVSQNAGSFSFLDKNPVLQTNEKDFRDPQVFWHNPTKKWIMIITKSDQRTIRFYSSKNLLQWEYMSEFKGRGAVKEVWEVPDMFEIPVNGDNKNKKWVLTCGMGPNRMQYWVGDFDGTRFTLDTKDNLLTGRNFQGDVFEDFETDLKKWTITGQAFGNSPVESELPEQQVVSGKMGFQYLNSYHGKDLSVGLLQSTPVKINQPFLNVLVGGGNTGKVGIRVIINQNEIGSTRNTRNSEQFMWRSIDLSKYIGETAIIEVFDEATGDWGHINIDQIIFSDVQLELRLENANWIDFGTDYYAGKSLRNYDADDSRLIYMAWMGNWTYAQNVPTSPWKGSQSLFREMELLYSEKEGYSLIQKPIKEYLVLRKSDNEINKTTFSFKKELKINDFRIPWNVAEFKISFEITKENGSFGIKLAQGSAQEIEVKFDPQANLLSVNRSQLPFSFSGLQTTTAPIFLNGKKEIDLHIFLDQASIEVFANDYKTRLSLLTFNEPDKNEVSLFSENEAKVKYLHAWELKSIWNIIKEVKVVLANEKEVIEKTTIYPNPSGNSIVCPSIQPRSKVYIIDLTGHIMDCILNEPQTVDVSKLLPGTYFLVVNNDGISEKFKFVKI